MSLWHTSLSDGPKCFVSSGYVHRNEQGLLELRDKLNRVALIFTKKESVRIAQVAALLRKAGIFVKENLWFFSKDFEYTVFKFEVTKSQESDLVCCICVHSEVVSAVIKRRFLHGSEEFILVDKDITDFENFVVSNFVSPAERLELSNVLV